MEDYRDCNFLLSHRSEPASFQNNNTTIVLFHRKLSYEVSLKVSLKSWKGRTRNRLLHVVFGYVVVFDDRFVNHALAIVCMGEVLVYSNNFWLDV